MCPPAPGPQNLVSIGLGEERPRGRVTSHASIVTLGRVGALGLAPTRELGESRLGIGYTYTLGPAKGAPDITRPLCPGQTWLGH